MVARILLPVGFITSGLLFLGCMADNAGGAGGAGGSGTTSASTGTSSTSGTGGGPTVVVSDCSAKALTDALSHTKPGDTVQLSGKCTYTGAFTVPADVTLLGAGLDQTTIVAGKGSVALTLTPGATETKLGDLTVQSGELAAVVGKGAGNAAIETVAVTTTRGIGVGFEGLKILKVKALNVTGPVTVDAAKKLLPVVLPKDTGTHGLVLIGVGDAQLDTVKLSAFGDYGALFINSGVTWNGGGSSDNLGTNLFALGAKIDLSNLDLCRSFQGNRKIPAFGGVFTAGANVTSNKINVCDNGGFGLFHGGVSGNHTDLTAKNNGTTALWVQSATSFSVGGKSVIEGNTFAGLVALESKNITVEGAAFGDTVSATLPYGLQSLPVQVGDGAHFVHTTGIRFQDVTFSSNGRTGLTLDLGTTAYDMANLQWINVTVDSMGTSFGALCQWTNAGSNKLMPAAMAGGWDSGITRTGAAVINDGKALSPQEIVGIIDPNLLPSPDLVLKGGLSALIAP